MWNWPKNRNKFLLELESLPYNYSKIVEKEDENWELFSKYPELVIPEFKTHQDLFNYAFGVGHCGIGVLDIGTGGGIFLERYLTDNFMPPRVGLDVIDISTPDGWSSYKEKASDFDKLGFEFDHIQCIETIEHLDEDIGLKVAEKMINSCNLSCLITCMGLPHHLGSLNITAVEKNPALIYKGQPNIEKLMSLGYTVRLSNNYQVVAWKCH
jgi:2-polyprenyl-3-methyl-5-hydroxy-6-metoxy-1,4-benzoquinol methylase